MIKRLTSIPNSDWSFRDTLRKNIKYVVYVHLTTANIIWNINNVHNINNIINSILNCIAILLQMSGRIHNNLSINYNITMMY